VVAAESELLMHPWRDVLDAHDLVRVLLHRPEWQHDAACRGQGPEAFFIERGGDLKPGRQLCRRCPVRIECFEFALAHDDVWGGTSHLQRHAARRRGIGAETMIAELNKTLPQYPPGAW